MFLYVYRRTTNDNDDDDDDDGIFNDRFITQSLLSPRVKKIENRSTFAEVLGN